MGQRSQAVPTESPKVLFLLPVISQMPMYGTTQTNELSTDGGPILSGHSCCQQLVALSKWEDRSPEP